MTTGKSALPQAIAGAVAALALNMSPATAEFGTGGPASEGFAACPSKAELLAGDVLEGPSTPCVAVVTFKPGVAVAERSRALARTGAHLRFGLDLIRGAAVFVPNEAALGALVNNPDVADIRPDGRARIMAPPGACEPWPECRNGGGDDDGGNGGGGSSQVVPSGVVRIGANQVALTGSGIGVAVVDTGVDLDHPDLAANIAIDCFFASSYSTCDDDNGHGTHVAGTIAAIDNDADVVGVAPEALIYAIKVLDSSGSGLHSEVLQGLQWVLDENVDDGGTLLSPLTISVVNMSLGDEIVCGSNDDPGYLEYVAALAAQGVVVVSAAGNDSSKEVGEMVPAGCPDGLAVASTSAVEGVSKCRFLANIPADVASFFTTDGAFDEGTGVGVTISAPGERQEDNSCGSVQTVGILSTALGGGTTEKSGTSMAAPHVAAVAALMIEADGTLGPEEDVRSAIRGSADRCGEVPLDHPYISETLDGELEGVVYAPDAIANLGGC